jgi:hypothetical protein
MRLVRVSLLALLLLSLLIPWGSVRAGDYVTDAIEALKTSNVYIAPGTENTDYNTVAKLQTHLREGDNIVLVMLPSEALAGTDMYSIAQKISAGLDNQKTVGLAVGREVIGYSTLLPEGVAFDKMSRADSVSNDPVTALITFTQNIHSWIKDNPLPTPTPVPTAIPTPRPTMAPIELPKTNEVTPVFWVPCLGVFFLVIVILAVKIKKTRDRNKYNSLMSKINRD